MIRRSKIVAVTLGGLALLGAGGAAYVLREIDEVQPFYAAAIQTDPLSDTPMRW